MTEANKLVISQDEFFHPVTTPYTFAIKKTLKSGGVGGDTFTCLEATHSQRVLVRL